MPFEQYLKKHAFTNQLIEAASSPKLGLIVVIPVYNEKSLLPTLNSLAKCSAPNAQVEVLLIFNASEAEQEEIRDINSKASIEVKEWQASQKDLLFRPFIIEQNHLPAKHAGVGLARKIGMDEAARRFGEINQPNGIIVCFDADSLCEANYLVAIETHFNKCIDIAASSIYFEHPLEGSEFSSEIYKGITWYELHLRYYKLGLAYANLPFAFHAIGSSMAVRAKDYCLQGGMNKRKAGEDFYFLQKFIDLGLLNELNSTRVIPSPRPSERVPFGTGRAITEMIDGKRNIELTYSFECFELLKSIFSNIEEWYNSDLKPNPIFMEFVGEEKFIAKIEEIRLNSSTIERFVKRFFQWFNGFQCLKFIHFLRDQYYPLKGLSSEVLKLLEVLGDTVNSKEPSELLKKLREIENPKSV